MASMLCPRRHSHLKSCRVLSSLWSGGKWQFQFSLFLDTHVMLKPPSPHWTGGSVVGARSCAPKGCGYDSPSRHMPRLWGPALSHPCFPLFLFLSKVNTNISAVKSPKPCQASVASPGKWTDITGSASAWPGHGDSWCAPSPSTCRPESTQRTQVAGSFSSPTFQVRRGHVPRVKW